VDAVGCGLRIQQELAEINNALPESRQMHFRIGINLGDVIVEGGEIYGNGVNIAARLQALAEPGEICISEAVYNAIGTKLPVEYEFHGEQNV
jgi:adenylate cyclase